MAKTLKDRLLTFGAAAAVGLSAIPLSNFAQAASGAGATKITVPVSKTVTGDYTGDEEFEFILTPVGDAPMPAGKTELSVKARAGETVNFEDIDVDVDSLPVGEHEFRYAVREKSGSDPNMTYDSETRYYTVRFTVSENADGEKTTVLANQNPIFAGTDYSIPTVLSLYNAFIQNDFETGTHISGGIAVGGSATAGLPYLGDDAPVASYVHKIDGPVAGYSPKIGDDKTAEYSGYDKSELVLYYNEPTSDLGPNCVQTDEVKVDFGAAFNAIKAESSKIANTPDIVVSEEHIKTITYNGFNPETMTWGDIEAPAYLEIELPASDCNVSIPKSILDKFGRNNLPINFVTPNGTLEDFQKYAYNISFPDSEELKFAQTGANLNDPNGSYRMSFPFGYLSIGYNGDFTQNPMQTMRTAHDGSVEGMKFVMNMPAAKNVTIHDQGSLAFHVVAPDADVIFSGGDGNIIAKNAYNRGYDAMQRDYVAGKTNEAHFYSYNKLPTEQGALTFMNSYSKEVKKLNVEISKQKVGGAELDGAKLTLTGKTADGSIINLNKDDLALGTDAHAPAPENDGSKLVWISGKTPTTVKTKT